MRASIEDLGVPGHQTRSLTKIDVTRKNVDLLDFYGSLLASERFTDLRTEIDGVNLIVRTTDLDRVDVYVDGRPFKSQSTDL